MDEKETKGMQAFGNQGKSVARIKINFAEELTND
jgi:hypothetical protein